jgi:hypothetical protein
MRISPFVRCAPLALVALAALAAASCGNVVRSSRSPVMLVVGSLVATPGGGTGTPSSVLASSVINLVTSPAPCTSSAPCRVVFNDVGSASMAVVMKDVTVTPTTNNQVTITGYHVAYLRSDGLNTPGVDVPYPFDGAVTVTIPAGGTGTVGFEIVRNVAKEESPLVELNSNQSTVINAIAQVTFYGHDIVGNDVSVMGSILVDFGDFAVGS